MFRAGNAIMHSGEVKRMCYNIVDLLESIGLSALTMLRVL